jgi:hypothetical protein
MKVLWTLLKGAVVLALLIPVSLLMLGVFGTVLGLAIVLLRLAVVGLLAYGAFKLVARLIRGPTPRATPREMPQRLGSADPYFDAAMRELDQELPEARARR